VSIVKLHSPNENVEIYLGTTIATNALLERRGAKTVFVTTKGFGDSLDIGNQSRAEIFNLENQDRSPLYTKAVEITERINAQGKILTQLNQSATKSLLEKLYQEGFESLAIGLIHSYKNPNHEKVIAKIAQEIGFQWVCCSHEISPTIKSLPRFETTVVNAYLSPLVNNYINKIRAQLSKKSQLFLLSSSGSINTPEQTLAKDLVLSGPAGGVLALKRLYDSLNTPLLGFDMGGTSTDSCEVHGPLRYRYENEKAGIPLTTPMLEIETVAAGGGSLCYFDGVMLKVGPQSAGANPGPACYGNGGPLALTDINLFLGYLNPENFPFKLKIDASIQGLKRVQEKMNAGLQKQISLQEIAEGFRNIANTSMALSMKKMVTAKGLNIEDYRLVSFGGAAGQHACAVADLLQVKEIIFSPFSSILSASGIKDAPQKFFQTTSVLRPLKEISGTRLQQIIKNHEAKLGNSESAQYQHFIEMRYEGQGAALEIALTTNPSQSFHKKYHQLYGYHFTHKPIEITTIRSEQILQFDHNNINLAFPSQLLRPNSPSKIPILTRQDLQSCDHSGPFLLVDSLTTFKVEKGWNAHCEDSGLIRLIKTREPNTKIIPRNHPAFLESFNCSFHHIAEEMGVSLQRTAISTNIKERLDFSCGLFTSTGNLVVNAPHIPVHLGAMMETLKDLIKDQELHDGDVFLTNNPQKGGSHLPDLTVITPVFFEEKLVLFTACRAHHAEIGGIVPGSMPTFSQSLSEEGVVFNHVRIIRKGEPQLEKTRSLLSQKPYPSRDIGANIADLESQIVANQRGKTLILDLIERFGLSTILEYMDDIQRASSEKVCQFLKTLPKNQQFFFRDFLDDKSPIQVSLTVKNSSMVIDFHGSAPTQKNNFNAGKAITHACILYVFRSLLAENIPLNSGVLDPLEVIIPSGILAPNNPEAPVCAGNVETSQRIVDALLGALNICSASQGTMNNLSFGNQHFGYYETIGGGGGATAQSHGSSGLHSHMTNTRNTDVEILESRYPVLLHTYSLRRGSGGNGVYQGGNGIIREIEFLEPLHCSLISGRRTFAPYGVQGGYSGAKGENYYFMRKSQQWSDLPHVFEKALNPGDRILLKTPGGGGFGPPSSINQRFRKD
jgi:5-oxoprolinase (ATP-hydrolysing)